MVQKVESLIVKLWSLFEDLFVRQNFNITLLKRLNPKNRFRWKFGICLRGMVMIKACLTTIKYHIIPFSIRNSILEHLCLRVTQIGSLRAYPRYINNFSRRNESNETISSFWFSFSSFPSATQLCRHVHSDSRHNAKGKQPLEQQLKKQQRNELDTSKEESLRHRVTLLSCCIVYRARAHNTKSLQVNKFDRIIEELPSSKHVRKSETGKWIVSHQNSAVKWFLYWKLWHRRS